MTFAVHEKVSPCHFGTENRELKSTSLGSCSRVEGLTPVAAKKAACRGYFLVSKNRRADMRFFNSALERAGGLHDCRRKAVGPRMRSISSSDPRRERLRPENKSSTGERSGPSRYPDGPVIAFPMTLPPVQSAI